MGSTNFDPGLSCTDPDGDTLEYHLISDTNSDRFSMDPSTGILTYAVEYDLDNPSSMTTPVLLNVYCKDGGNLTSAAQITLTIEVSHIII